MCSRWKVSFKREHVMLFSLSLFYKPNYSQNNQFLYWVRHLTFFFWSTSAYFVNDNTQLMSDLTDNQFYALAVQIWLCIRLKNARNLFISNLQNYKFFLPHPSKRDHFVIKSCSYQPQKPVFLLNTSKTCSNIELLSFFSKNFLEINFRYQNKNNVIETISCQTNIAYMMCLNT